MTMKKKYAKRARISERKFQQLVRLFSADLDASQIARLTGLNRNTVKQYLTKIRQRLVEYCEAQSPFSGEAEVDESFFGARRIKGIKRPWRIRQNDCLRHLSTERPRLSGNRSELLQSHAASGYTRQSRTRKHYLL